MCDKFSFPVELRESSKEVLFQSETEEDYYVNFVVTKLDEIVLSVEWVNPNKNLIKVELFTEDFKLISSQMAVGDRQKACFKFSIGAIKQPDEHITNQNYADERKLMFVITSIPYIDAKDYAIASGDKKKALNDDKIRELSEDLLAGLALDMRDLLIHGDLSDATITNGKYAVKVHAAILSARSPVFHDLFKDPSSEKLITIPHASTEALNDMIVFIYSGLIKFKDIDRVEELYELAYKYELQDLHEACSVYMSSCTLDRVLQTLILAEKHRDDSLKSSAIRFILENLGELKSSERWESFTKDNTDLTSEIFNSISGPLERDALRAFMSRLSAKKLSS